jgi:hypothetical protein
VLERKRSLFNELIEQNGPPASLGHDEEEIFSLFDIRARPKPRWLREPTCHFVRKRACQRRDERCLAALTFANITSHMRVGKGGKGTG